MYKNCSLTIAKKSCTACIPCAEYDLLKCHLGHHGSGSFVDILPQSQHFSIFEAQNVERTNLSIKSLSGFMAPFGFSKRVVSLRGFLVQEVNDGSAHGVAGGCGGKLPFEDFG